MVWREEWGAWGAWAGMGGQSLGAEPPGGRTAWGPPGGIGPDPADLAGGGAVLPPPSSLLPPPPSSPPQRRRLTTLCTTCTTCCHNTLTVSQPRPIYTTSFARSCSYNNNLELSCSRQRLACTTHIIRLHYHHTTLSCLKTISSIGSSDSEPVAVQPYSTQTLGQRDTKVALSNVLLPDYYSVVA